jgi:threonylcarbamoyladenosine tRNA methylthiotransferase MtaB
MKRRHSREDSVRFCAMVRRLRPDTAFSADVIVGFPTENEAMFQNSLRLVDDCGLARAHVFPFSPRPGTPAARMPQTPGDIARDRAGRLRSAADQAWRRHLQAKIGRTFPVLMERGGIGRAEDFTPVRIDSGAPGAICDVVAVATNDRGELKARLATAAA